MARQAVEQGISTIVATPHHNSKLVELNNSLQKPGIPLHMQMLEANLVHFIASDAHNVTTRDSKIKEAYELIEKIWTGVCVLFEGKCALYTRWTIYCEQNASANQA